MTPNRIRRERVDHERPGAAEPQPRRCCPNVDTPEELTTKHEVHERGRVPQRGDAGLSFRVSWRGKKCDRMTTRTMTMNLVVTRSAGFQACRSAGIPACRLADLQVCLCKWCTTCFQTRRPGGPRDGRSGDLRYKVGFMERGTFNRSAACRSMRSVVSQLTQASVTDTP